MQPYFLPYIGYFQLIHAVDKFVIYDNIKYTKKGWINRNRMLLNGKDQTFSIPIKKDSDYLNVDERELAPSFTTEREKLLRKWQGNYRKAPFFKDVMPLMEAILRMEEMNLFTFIHASLKQVLAYLDCQTELVISSTIPIDHDLKSQDKVLAICQALDAMQYINPSGGVDLYDRETFKTAGIQLHFLQSKPIEYPQFKQPFVPWLSILDVLMFNSKEQVQQFLTAFELR